MSNAYYSIYCVIGIYCRCTTDFSKEKKKIHVVYRSNTLSGKHVNAVQLRVWLWISDFCHNMLPV